MKKRIAGAVLTFKQRMMNVKKLNKKCVKAEIRAIADNYEDFNDLVFELGCEVLAREFLKGCEKP